MAFHLVYLIPAAGILAYEGIKKLIDNQKKSTLESTQDEDNAAHKEQSLSVNNNVIQKVEEEEENDFAVLESVNKNLAISSVSLGLATFAAFFYSPLQILVYPIIVYQSIPVFKKAYRKIVKERKSTVELPFSIAIVGILLKGYYLIASFSFLLYFIGDKLLSKVQDNTVKKLTTVFTDHPRYVWLKLDDVETEVPFETIKPKDTVVINAGETIAVDGKILEGVALINQHILTGESKPVEKGVGEEVFATTILLAGRIYVEVEKSGDDTVAAQIGHILNQTIDYKMSKELQVVEASNQLVLPHLAICAASAPFVGTDGSLSILWSGLGEDIRFLGPLSLLNFIRIAAQNHLLIRDGRSFEMLNSIDTVVFDKTGTLTLDEPRVAEIHASSSNRKDEILQYAAWAEHRHTHPIARAILKEARIQGMEMSSIEGAHYEVGFGIKGFVENHHICVGSARFMDMERIEISNEIQELVNERHENGHSLVMVAKDRQLIGAIELRTAIRPEVKGVIGQLRQRGLSIYILSGDHAKPTQLLAEELGVDRWYAEVFPEKKSSIIEQLQEAGKSVCFIGDGINDSIAMKKAHVSVSLRGASTVAVDTAEVLLLDGTLIHVPKLFEIAEDLNKNIERGVNITLSASVINIVSVFTLHTSILFAILLDNASLLAGVFNSFLPILKYGGNEDIPGPFLEGNDLEHPPN